MRYLFKYLIHIVFLMALMFPVACGQPTYDGDLQASGGSEIGNPVYDVTVAGVAQKGPFLKGAAIEILELDDLLAQTGRRFQTSIGNDLSEYGCRIRMAFPYALFSAQGYYFDEISGLRSDFLLQIDTVADIRATRVNINLLTTLSTKRIVYLVTNDGMAFDDAKAQAQTEVLALFGIDATQLLPFEDMNILEDGDEHAALLAVSAILMQMAHNTEPLAVSAGLSYIIAQIQDDIEADGVINIFNVVHVEIDEARQTIDAETVRSNLETRYQSLDPTITIPDFEQYLTVGEE